jgi:hypothetical protein
MPQKTVYIRDEDLPLWEQAARLSDGSLASVLADALRAHVERHSSVTQDSPQEGRAIAAPHGEKMIQLDVRLFTDEIASPGKIIPKHAWDTGMVTVQTNPSHGLKKGEPIPFNSLLELPVAIEKLFLKKGIVLHAGSRSRKYFRTAPVKSPAPKNRKASK